MKYTVLCPFLTRDHALGVPSRYRLVTAPSGLRYLNGITKIQFSTTYSRKKIFVNFFYSIVPVLNTGSKIFYYRFLECMVKFG
jgi:hypothetical protein